MKKRQDYKELARRLEVSHFVPPDSTVELARERTEGMTLYFERFAGTLDWWSISIALRSLICSAYLQGVRDCAEAVYAKNNRS